MTKQNRRHVIKEIGKLLSEIWRIKGLAEQEYGPRHPIAKSSPACIRMYRNCCGIDPWQSVQKLFRIPRQAWSGVGGSSDTSKAHCPAHPQPCIEHAKKTLKCWASIIIVEDVSCSNNSNSISPELTPHSSIFRA